MGATSSTSSSPSTVMVADSLFSYRSWKRLNGGSFVGGDDLVEITSIAGTKKELPGLAGCLYAHIGKEGSNFNLFIYGGGRAHHYSLDRNMGVISYNWHDTISGGQSDSTRFEL